MVFGTFTFKECERPNTVIVPNTVPSSGGAPRGGGILPFRSRVAQAPARLLIGITWYRGVPLGCIEGPAKTIAAVATDMAAASDEQILTAIAALEPLPDEP